jgi:membrane-associated phospholipid phosphatase
MKLSERKIFGQELKEYKHLLILPYYLVIGLLYLYVNKTVLPDDIQVLMRFPLIDDMIPFVKYMVIPYYVWYPYIVLPLIYFAIVEKDSFIKLAIFLYGGMTLSYIIFIIMPNGIGIGFRPEITDTDFFSTLIKNIYAIDNPTNSCPSIHVLNTMAIHASIVNSQKLGGKKWLVNLSRVTAVLIYASTVMIKQHSIIDVIASFVIGGIIYMLLYGKVFSRKKVTQESV